jgi:hypothetical protein
MMHIRYARYGFASKVISFTPGFSPLPDRNSCLIHTGLQPGVRQKHRLETVSTVSRWPVVETVKTVYRQF